MHRCHPDSDAQRGAVAAGGRREDHGGRRKVPAQLLRTAAPLVHQRPRPLRAAGDTRQKCGVQGQLRRSETRAHQRAAVAISEQLLELRHHRPLHRRNLVYAWRLRVFTPP